jgi:hypothetical protein
MKKYGLLLFLLGLVFALPPAGAMPNFARREGVQCEMCHTQIPRVNRYGYEYRAAGFRQPDNIGKVGAEEKFNLGDLFAARFQANVTDKKNGGGGKNDFQLGFKEVTFYPLTGSWGKYFSSLGEFSMESEDVFEIENAYVRFNYGDPNQYFHVRFGVVHPWEGFGGSDRVVGLSRPLFQTKTANNNQDTFFTPWGYDQMGLEGGYHMGGLHATATVFNGNIVALHEGGLKGFPAQGGGLTKGSGFPSQNRKDIQLVLTQFLTDTSGVSAYYYHGWMDLPISPAAVIAADDITAADVWRNSFDRVAAYGYGEVLPHLSLQGGAELGLDHYYAAGAVQGRFKSYGLFGEVLVPVVDRLTTGLRYDFFDPSTRVGDNHVQAVTFPVNYSIWEGLQSIVEYKFTDTALGAAGGTRKDHSVELRAIFIL